MQKRGGKYRVQYHDSSGRKKSVTFDKKADAQAFEEKVRRERQLIRTGLELPKKSELVLDYAAKHLRRRFQVMKASTMDAEERHIKRFVEHCGLRVLRSITTKDVRDYLDWAQGEFEWSNATRNRARAYLHIMFQQAFEDEELMVNPVSRIALLPENPAKKVPLTPEQAEAFIQAAEGALERLFATILVYQGPRISELIALRHVDFALAQGVLYFRRIREQVTGEYHDRIKGSLEGIVVPMTEVVRSRYLELKQTLKHASPEEYIFLDQEGNPMTNYQGKCLVERLALRAKIDRKVTPHYLRATFASLGEEAGLSKEELQRLMGHSTVTVTERYTTMRRDHLKGRLSEVGFGVSREPGKVVPMRKPKR
jgi:site-specific recombinase XerD